MELVVSDLDELPNAAEQILTIAGDNRVFLFYGEMGAGKTTLIKALCRVLKVNEPVSSPTFSIVNEYIGAGRIIYHFDFYRIKEESEAFDLGFEDYLYSGNYCFIEWPEKIPNSIPDSFVKVNLFTTLTDERIINVQKLN